MISDTNKLAHLTGYISGVATYNEAIPTDARIRILQKLIAIHKDDQDIPHWIEEWENKIKELSA